MRDEKLHSHRKRKLVGLYNMSTMVHYEPAVNDMNQLLVRKFDEYASQGTLIDLPEFMQYYAFDVIGKITVCATAAFTYWPRLACSIFSVLDG